MATTEVPRRSNSSAGGGRQSKRSAARRRTRRVRRRGGRWWSLLVLLLLIAGGVYWGLQAGWLREVAQRHVPLPGLQPPQVQTATLFFADPRWTRLVAEQRDIPAGSGAVAAATELVRALAEGSRQQWAPVLPVDTHLRGAYVGSNGLLVLDFAPDLLQFEPGGVSGEVLTVYALVNTMAENIAGVTRVQLLVAGAERETLAGHVKISEPLAPDPQWTAVPAE